MLLVNSGLEVVRSRRAGCAEGGNNRSAAVPGGVEYVHNYPQIVGRVEDDESGKPIPDAVVTLLLDGEPVLSVDDGWHNPCTTRRQTRGYFSFWPHPRRHEAEHLVARATITVEHPEYDPFIYQSDLTTDGSYGSLETIDGDSILNLESFRLLKKQ
jgi:hypothetical protein